MDLQLHDPAFLAVASGGTPALDLFFSATKALDSRITFTRGSSATFINSSGLVETAGSGVARFTHDPVTLASLGILIEESRTNLLLRSEEFENASWTKNAMTATASAGTSPDGTNNARSLIPSTASAGHNVLQSVSKSASAIAYTVSLFAKPNGYGFVGFRIDDGGANGAYVCFDVTLGTVSTAASTSGTGFSGASASIVSYPNGWKLLRLSFTSNAGTVIRPVLTVQNATGNPFTYSFAGDGTSGVLVWGAQLEAGAFATSYIPTTSATVTRAADVATMTGTNFSSWYNSSEGTFAVAYRPQQLGLYQQILQVDDGTGNNRAPSLSQRDTNFARLDWSSGGTTQISNFLASGSISLANTLVATSYKIGVGGSIAANGTVNTASAAITTPTVDRLVIGNRSATNAYLNAPIARIRYYRRRLPDANLQTLTT